VPFFVSDDAESLHLYRRAPSVSIDLTDQIATDLSDWLTAFCQINFIHYYEQMILF
jgi:hypothetical protein